MATKPRVSAKPSPIGHEYHSFTEHSLVFSVDGDKLAHRYLSPFELRHNAPEGVAEVFTLPLGNLNPALPLGITAMVGQTGSGKSTLIRYLAEHKLPIVRYLTVEAFDSAVEVETLYPYDEADHALAAHLMAVVNARKRAQPVPFGALDSLRAPVYETTGSAGGKGVIKRFFTQLTRVSNALAVNGVSLLVTINPLEDGDAAFADGFIKMLKSAVPAVINLSQATEEGWSGEYTVRESSSDTNRQAIAFRIRRDTPSSSVVLAPDVYELRPAVAPVLPLAIFSLIDIDNLVAEPQE